MQSYLIIVFLNKNFILFFYFSFGNPCFLWEHLNVGSRFKFSKWFFFVSRINLNILKITLLCESEISIQLWNRKSNQAMMTPQYLNKVMGYIKESILPWVHLTKLIMLHSITVLGVSSQMYFGCFSLRSFK